MDYLSPEDIQSWCELINSAYDDAECTPETAKEMLSNHPFLTQNETVFLVKGGQKVATISYGLYRSQMDTAGFFRIAVAPQSKRLGYGTLLLHYAEDAVFEKGILMVEEAIALKRIPSLKMHFKMGYKPEKSTRERAFKRNARKQFLYAVSGYDLLINLKTKRIYQSLQGR